MTRIESVIEYAKSAGVVYSTHYNGASNKAYIEFDFETAWLHIMEKNIDLGGYISGPGDAKTVSEIMAVWAEGEEKKVEDDSWKKKLLRAPSGTSPVSAKMTFGELP